MRRAVPHDTQHEASHIKLPQTECNSDNEAMAHPYTVMQSRMMRRGPKRSIHRPSSGRTSPV